MSAHPTISAFGVANDQLAIGGAPVELLAERVGTTPFFAYDRRLLDARVGLLRTTLPDGIDLSYAVKANPMPAVVQHLSSLVDCFDVASALEMRTGLDTPMPAMRISFAGPGKTPAELSQAVAAGVTVTLESRTEAERVISTGARLGVRPRVAVRVNPDFRVKGSGMRMGGGPQQFGIDAEQVPELLGDLSQADVEILGFHVFAGSQNLDAEIISEAQRATVELVIELAQSAPAPITYLNLGGGFGIPYFDRDSPLDLGLVGENLATVLDERIRPSLPEARVVVELGRYIVGECGVYVTRVLDRKDLTRQDVCRRRRRPTPPAGRVWELRPGDPAQLPRGGGEPARAGPDGDGQRGRLPVHAARPARRRRRASRDGDRDLIVVFQAGAYGLTASPTAFLGHPEPVEVLV